MKKIFFIFALMFASFVVTGFVSNTVFIANSPAVNTNFTNTIAQNINQLFGNSSSFFAFLNARPQVSVPLQANDQYNAIMSQTGSIPFTQVAKGIYAKETSTAKVVQVRVNEVNWEVHTYVVNGKTITLRIPKGDPTPGIEELK